MGFLLYDFAQRALGCGGPYIFANYQAAMDQRGSLKKALGQLATDAGLEEFAFRLQQLSV